MAVGFVYAVINPEMPSLVKVGHTTRPVADRVRELSSSTGVPKPFTLIYSITVNDSAAAESYMHTALSLSESRVSPNREFFSSPIDEVIRHMIECEKAFPVTDNTIEHNLENEDFLDEDEELSLAETLIEEANETLWGGDFIDYDLAETYLLQAKNLGSAEAATLLADMYDDENSPKYSKKRAIKNLQFSAKLEDDNFLTLLRLSRLYEDVSDLSNCHMVMNSIASGEFADNLINMLPDTMKLNDQRNLLRKNLADLCTNENWNSDRVFEKLGNDVFIDTDFLEECFQTEDEYLNSSAHQLVDDIRKLDTKIDKVLTPLRLLIQSFQLYFFKVETEAYTSWFTPDCVRVFRFFQNNMDKLLPSDLEMPPSYNLAVESGLKKVMSRSFS